MKRISIYLMAGILMTSFSFTSCEKEEETSPLVELMETDDEVAAFYDDILSEVDEVTFNDGTSKSGVTVSQGFSGTRTVVTEFSGDTVIHTITFDNFMNENSNSGRVKNGTIIIKVLGRPYLETFWRQVTFVNFTVNDNLIEGVKVIEKTGEYQFTVALTDGKITFTDETTYTRNFTRTRTWIDGYATPYYIWDDEFTLEGNAWGVNRNGNEYTHEITSPLFIKRDCRWVVSGTIEFNVNGQAAILDYGDGTCDRIATLISNGETHTINLRGGQN